MSDGRTPRLAVVVMAAGKGTRMNSPETAKVMFAVGGRPMIGHVVERGVELDASPIVVIVGHQGEAVRSWLRGEFPNAPILTPEQREQLGTAHAVMQAAPALEGFDGNVLVLSGDVPLLTLGTLQELIAAHREHSAAGTLLSVAAPDPTGYGRVVRLDDGTVDRIVEHKDATESEREVDEINAGVYVFNAKALFEALPNVSNENAQGEYYLPDVFKWFRMNEYPIAAYRSDSFDEIQGINTTEQLQQATAVYEQRTKAL